MEIMGVDRPWHIFFHLNHITVPGQVVSVHPNLHLNLQCLGVNLRGFQNFTHPHGEPYWNVHMSQRMHNKSLRARQRSLGWPLECQPPLGILGFFLQQWKGQQTQKFVPSGKLIIIAWAVPPPSKSHHQDYYIFSRESL